MTRNTWTPPHATRRQRVGLWLVHYATQRGNPLRWQAQAALWLAERIGAA